VAILGDAGAGKSTLMRQIAHRALSDGLRIPILLPVPSYAAQLGTNGGPSLPEVAAEYWQTRGAPGLAPIFAAALDRGDALILFDGFDEAGDRRTRQQTAARITEDMIRWRDKPNQWVLTSRPYGYSDAPLPDPAVTRVTITAWDDSQIEEALRGWCRALARWQSGNSGATPDEGEAQTRAVRLRDQLRNNEPLQQLARNPLSLAMLVLLERMRNKLPEHRVRLYEAYADELIQRRHPPETGNELEPAEFLIELALWIQRKHPLGRVHAAELAEQCIRIALRYEGYLRPEDASEDILALATDRAQRFYHVGMVEIAGGILVESSPEFLSFSHRALQDFFLGRALARMSSEHRWELLRPRLHAARWREPLLLCVGWLAAVERRREEIDLLCQQVLTANSDEEPLLARDLRLAIAVAVDSAGLVRHQRLADFHRRMEYFSATFRSFAAFRMSLENTALLARLGLRQAQDAIDSWIEGSPKDFQRLALTTLRGKLDGPGGQHLRELAVQRLTSEDHQQNHFAWHALLPLWNQSDTIRESLLAAIDRAQVPSCPAIRRDLAVRGLESPTPVRERIYRHAPLGEFLLSALCDNWPAPEPAHAFILTLIRSETPLGVQLATRLARRPNDPLLRPEFVRLLGHPDPEVRLDLLKHLANPRYGESVAEFVELGLADPEETVRQYAARVAGDLPFHIADGVRQAREFIQGIADERARVARNLRPEWWSVEDLRPGLLALFSADDPDVATTAFRDGFAYLFTGQEELIVAAVQALGSEHVALREAALIAISSHLHTIPAFADAVLSLLDRHKWPDIPRLIKLLHPVVDKRDDVRARLCEILSDSESSLDIRRAAVAGLARVARHDSRVWNAVKSVVCQAHTKLDWSLFSDAHGVLLRLGDFLPAEGLRRGIVFLDNRRAGVLEETPTGTRFTYDDAWLSDPAAMAISLTMPLRALPYESDRLHPFFDNMLPEGWLLERVSGAEKIDKRDRLGILLATGSDAIGAVSVIPDSATGEDG
jgi:HipA-like protein